MTSRKAALVLASVALLAGPVPAAAGTRPAQAIPAALVPLQLDSAAAQIDAMAPLEEGDQQDKSTAKPSRTVMAGQRKSRKVRKKRALVGNPLWFLAAQILPSGMSAALVDDTISRGAN